MVNFGSLRRVKPISQVWGLDRGQPVDRYYIEEFLTKHSLDIQGHILEIGDNKYTRKFGKERVIKSEILHISEDDPRATIVADLTQADHVRSNTFDCIICTQTLHLIYDVHSAIQTLYRILKPGGALLATTPGISQISRYDMDRWGDYWRFTSASLQRITACAFPQNQIFIDSYGNVLAAAAFLYGVAAGELSEQELDYKDVDYEVIISLKAIKQRDKE
jgi:SAM-dependent methyltransferase